MLGNGGGDDDAKHGDDLHRAAQVFLTLLELERESRPRIALFLKFFQAAPRNGIERDLGGRHHHGEKNAGHKHHDVEQWKTGHAGSSERCRGENRKTAGEGGSMAVISRCTRAVECADRIGRR